MINENNWLGEGKRVGFDVTVDQDSLKGTISYSDPNYDFLGNAINYSLSSTTNDKPNQGYSNTLLSGGIDTSFEQYKDIFVNLGLSASFDDLQTESTASSSLKKQRNFTEFAAVYGLVMIKETGHLCQRMDLL